MNTSLPTSFYERALAAVGHAVIATDLDGRVLYWNAAAEELYGYEASQAVGSPVADLFTLDDRLVAATERWARLVSGEPYRGDHEVRDRNGRLLTVHLMATPVRGDTGEVAAVLQVTHDVTAIRSAEACAARALSRAQALFEALALRAGDVALVLDVDARLTYVSPAAIALLGYAPEKIIGNLAAGFIHPDDVAGVRAVFHGVRAIPGRSDTTTFRVLHADGDWRWIENVITNCLDDPDIAGVISNVRDVTSRVEAERALRASEAWYRTIAETVQEGIWTVDLSGRTVYANDKLADIFGVPLEEVYRRTGPDLLGPDNAAWINTRVERRAELGSEEYDLSYPHPDGSTRLLHFSASPLRDDTGLAGSLVTISDVTCARQAERELQQRVLYDQLTGLANRSLLIDRLERAVARSARTKKPVAVLMADLDQFKLINDTWGHEAGDRLLVGVGQRLVAAVRPEDTVARFGGDGFIVVCEDTDEARAREVARQLAAALAEPVELDGRRLHVRASIGIAVCPPHSGPDLVRFAEAAMYEAKARGRDRVQVFDDSLADDSADRLALSNDLRDALARDELVLHYQPVIHLATGQPIGVEALARWHHPTRGPVSPAKFAAVAEATGLASALDRWALDRVRRDFPVLRAAMPDRLHVAVNISAAHFGDSNLEETVLSTLRTGLMSADELMLEVTESAMMDDLNQARAVLERLRAHGIQSAIDDFGTGYSSLGYLSRLPAATLKIDRSFIENITEDGDTLAIVSSVIRLTRTMGLDTIAEGVETPQQLALLRELGCTAAQGYLFSPAVAPATLAEVVADLHQRSPEVAVTG